MSGLGARAQPQRPHQHQRLLLHTLHGRDDPYCAVEHAQHILPASDKAVLIAVSRLAALSLHP
jgi:hypothetical protein